MKREDSKKHYIEEKPGLRKEIILNSILLSLLCISNLYAQIPINGFCRYREFPVRPGYTNINAIDYNSDGYRDIVLNNPQQNKYSTLTADSKYNFGYSSEKYSSVAPAFFYPIGFTSGSKKYFMLSRKTREVCEISFSRSGNYSVNSKTKLNGFATSISVGKLDDNGKIGAVVAGPGLDGISILKSRNNRLFEADRIKGKIFSSVELIDLNYDSFQDIAAFDLVSNSIIFYYNDQLGDFEESRSIPVGGEARDFQATDINSNGFVDLAYIKNGKLEILLGDSVSSFQNKIVLNSEVAIDKYTILDFNGDGYNDIAFINTSAGELYISYAKGINEFYPPILYLRKNNLTDLTSYVDRGGRKLAALSSDGKVFLINTLSFTEDSFSIALGEKPIAVQAFDYRNDGFKDFVFIDAGSNALKVGLSERRNLFRTYFDIPLSTNPNNILVDDLYKNSKTFFCYQKGGNTIEVTRYDFDKQTTKNLVLYTNQPIVELKFLSDRLKDRINLFALTKESGKLFLQNYELRELRPATADLVGLAINVENASLSLNIFKDIYTLSKFANSIDIIKTIFDKKVLSYHSQLSFQNNNEPVCGSFTSVGELFENTKPTALVLSMGKKSALFFFKNNEYYKIPLKNYFSCASPLRYFIEEENEISFFLYDENRGRIYRLLMDSRKKSVKESTLFEMKGINDYLVLKINANNRRLILSNNTQNSITFIKF